MTVFVLSPHAAQRVIERTKLTPDDVTTLLNRIDPIFTGYQNSDNRVHIVFYSVPDERCFFAVANMRDGAVATILTLGQYIWRYGPVDVGRLTAAKRRMLPAHLPRENALVLGARVCVNGAIAARTLGRAPGFSAGSSPEALAEDPELLAIIRERCAARGIDFNAVLAITVRATLASVPIELPLELPGGDALLRNRWAQSLAMGLEDDNE